MAFTEGQQVQLRTFGTPVNGKDAVIKGTITKLTKAHAIVCLNTISEGLQLAVKPSGDLVIFGAKDKPEKDWTVLKAGDVEAVRLSGLCGVDPPKPAPEWITREHAEHMLGKFAFLIDRSIRSGGIKQSFDGKLRYSDVAYYACAAPTIDVNLAAEQLRTATEQEKAQEARKYVEKVGMLSSR